MYLDTMCHWLVFLKLCTLGETEAEVKRSFRQIDITGRKTAELAELLVCFQQCVLEKKKKKIEPQCSTN